MIDLNASDPLVRKLNKEIDDPENENLRTLTEDHRRSITCQALISVKFDRNLKVHEVLIKGQRVKKIVLFNDDHWNEGIKAFMNGHRTGVHLQLIEYEPIQNGRYRCDYL